MCAFSKQLSCEMACFSWRTSSAVKGPAAAAKPSRALLAMSIHTRNANIVYPFCLVGLISGLVVADGIGADAHHVLWLQSVSDAVGIGDLPVDQDVGRVEGK